MLYTILRMRMSIYFWVTVITVMRGNYVMRKAKSWEVFMLMRLPKEQSPWKPGIAINMILLISRDY